MSFSGGSISTVDRTLFLGANIPNHVKNLHKIINSVNKSVFHSLVELCSKDFESKSVTPEMYQAIKESSEDSSNVDVVYSAIYFILKSALKLPKSSLKKEIFCEDLKELKISDDCIAELESVVFGPKRVAIDEALDKKAPHLPKLESLKWRVDVTISTSSLNRVLEPTLLMETSTTDGKKESFEVQPSQFHKLRFAVATLLKEFEQLEQRNVLKLQI